MLTEKLTTIKDICAGYSLSSFVDYPGEIASVLFTCGCNYRCRYCHNGELATASLPLLPTQDILNKIEAQLDYIGAIVVTGGEPTIHGQNLLDLMNCLKLFKKRLKIDSNGSEPRVIEQVLPLVDYVAMDIKGGSQQTYDKITPTMPANFEAVKQSIALVKASGVQHEFRLTWATPLVGMEDLELILKLVGDSPLFGQTVQPQKMLDPTFRAEFINSLGKKPLALEGIPNFKTR